MVGDVASPADLDRCFRKRSRFGSVEIIVNVREWSIPVMSRNRRPLAPQIDVNLTSVSRPRGGTSDARSKNGNDRQFASISAFSPTKFPGFVAMCPAKAGVMRLPSYGRRLRGSGIG